MNNSNITETFYQVPKEYQPIMMALQEAGKTEQMLNLCQLVGRQASAQEFANAIQNEIPNTRFVVADCSCEDCQAEAREANTSISEQTQQMINELFDELNSDYETSEQTQEPIVPTSSAPNRQLTVMAHNLYDRAMSNNDLKTALDTLYFIQNNDLT